MSVAETLPLLRLLGENTDLMLSRGELKRNNISDEMINEAESAGYIFIVVTENMRNGKNSIHASVFLSDDGEKILDENMP